MGGRQEKKRKKEEFRRKKREICSCRFCTAMLSSSSSSSHRNNRTQNSEEAEAAAAVVKLPSPAMWRVNPPRGVQRYCTICRTTFPAYDNKDDTHTRAVLFGPDGHRCRACRELHNDLKKEYDILVSKMNQGCKKLECLPEKQRVVEIINIWEQWHHLSNVAWQASIRKGGEREVSLVPKIVERKRYYQECLKEAALLATKEQLIEEETLDVVRRGAPSLDSIQFMPNK